MEREKVVEILMEYDGGEITQEQAICRLCKDEPRKPVCSFINNTCGKPYSSVVCDDGSVWEFIGGANGWQQLYPIPGTRADLEGEK